MVGNINWSSTELVRLLVHVLESNVMPCSRSRVLTRLRGKVTGRSAGLAFDIPSPD